MPELSRFFGIVIRMFAEAGALHHRPHFHALYQDALATFALDSIECIGGGLPRTQHRLVEAWAEIIMRSSFAIGNSCNPAVLPSRLSHYAEGPHRMGHAIHRVEHFEVVGPYTLKLRFADRSERHIDFRPVLEGELFGPLQDLTMFNAVELDPAFGTVEWPNGADFDPETLHDWPVYSDELAAMARRWAQAANRADARANDAMEPTRR